MRPSQPSWAGRSVLLATIGAAMLGGPTEVASAASTLHASPSGSGSLCSVAAPCTIQEALALAAPGDTVVMAGNEGTYGTPATPIATELQVPAGGVLEGAGGQTTPQVYSSATVAVRLSGGAGERLSNLVIHYAGPEAVLQGTGTVERVLALAGGTANGCELGPGSQLIDSVCSGRVGVWENVGEAWTLTVRNSTIIGSEIGMLAVSAVGLLQITAVNTIIRGATNDIRASQAGTGTVSVALDHSNYANLDVQNGATVTAPGSGSNQIAPPLFANEAGGDFSQTGASPTIDAGVNEAANGALDLAGNQRILPRQLSCAGTEPAITDIGAYEFVPVAPVCPVTTPPPATAPLGPAAPTTSIIKAKIGVNAVTFRFRGTVATGSPRFECKLDRKPFRPCSSPKSYRHLKPGRHSFAVRAVGAGGSDRSPAVRRFRAK